MTTLVSCTSDDFSSDIKQSEYVCLKLDAGASSVSSRVDVPGITEWNENLINTVDVFVFDNQARIHYQRIENLQLNGSGEITLSLSKERVSSGTYTIYVLANYSGEKDLSTITTIEGLKQVSVTTDFNFAKPNGGYEPSFLMDGKLENVSLAADTPPTVELYRAAAKIQVNIEGGTDEKDGTKYELIGGQQKKIINYATRSKLLAEGDEITDKGLKNMDTYLLFSESKAVFYTYANSWAFDPETSQVDLNNETYILLNIPVKKISSDGTIIEELNPNYYRVSLNRNTGEQSLERNHFYEITVKVMAAGSSTEVTPVSLEGKIQVQDWHPVDINVGADDAKYLEVSEEYMYLANISDDSSLKFYSSSVITKIVVSDVKYTDKYGVERSITESGSNYPDGATYYPTVKWDQDQTTGAVTIHSALLINVPKTFTLTITNEDGLTKKVEVEQYPLEYVTSTQGWYSYRSDFGSDWLHKGTGTVVTDDNVEGNFGSKVVKSINADGTSHAYKYRWNSGNGGQPSYNRSEWQSSGKPYFNSEQNGGRTNARMYHVRITAASDEYKLGYPRMDKDGYTALGEDNAQVVFPSFMIASQLGNTDATNSWEEAKSQCANYVEVTNVSFDGVNRDIPDDSESITYNDWRLPTPAELQIIAKFQKIENSAIDIVLVSNNYWSSNGKESVRTDGDAGTRIRCVRDVKPEN